MHNHQIQKRRVGVKYYTGEHKALTDVSPVSQVVGYKACISNEEASKWASHAEGRNISQVPIIYIEITLSKFVSSLIN